jgi:predicted ATPase/class 3 adenylate cyclase
MKCARVVEQPCGTVTLVFTDIEGSTRLLRELGNEGYREALAERRRAVREAFARHQGYEVDYEGDAFFYGFGSAPAALEAVSEAMRALEGGPIRIRVGLHTGDPILDPPKYVGEDVHLAARIMSAGHGGQVLLSRATAELVDGMALVELGEHRLKDFDEPVQLVQLGDGAFPPLKTISNTNLPRPASSFVGREREVAEVVSLVREGARLVTLTGPGGSGKTRLAIEAAAELVGEFKAGVFWVGLASVRDPALVLETVAQTLGAKDGLAAHIGERELLLVLDNLEQVVEAAADLAALVESCPSLRLLCTSRELLRVRGEVEYEVLPLAEPDAVELFCARAQVAASPPVEELCRRLDNMPLALELAAARTRALTPEQILDRLSQRLDLLKGGRDADPRQQTLRATIAWSYDLLTPAEQQLFARLAVFAGGCTLAAAEEVADADVDLLQSLVEKSLLRHTGDRFWMLETIREYAWQRLETGPEAATVRRRHAAWVLDWGSHFDVRRPDQATLLQHLSVELPNVRSALDELSQGDRDCERLQLVTSLAQAMYHLGAARESRDRLVAALEAGQACPAGARARALAHASIQSTLTGEAELGARYAAEAEQLARDVDEPELRADVLYAASVAELGLGNLAQGERLTAEALAAAEALGNPYRIAEARNNRSYVALLAGELPRAREVAEAGLRDARLAADHGTTASLLHNLFLVAIKSDDLDGAVAYVTEALELSRRYSLGTVMPFAVEGAAAIAARDGAHQLTATLLGATSSTASTGGVEGELRVEAGQSARAALGDEAFDGLCAAGARLNLEEAAERAARWLGGSGR